MTILLRDGISALTTSALAETVGVTTGALFRHYPSREAILVALAARVATRLKDDLTAAPDLDAAAQLRAFVKSRQGTVHRMPAAPAMVLSPDLHLALPEEGRALLAGVVRETFAHVTALVQRGQRDGVFRRDVTPQQAATAVLGMLAIRALSRALPSPIASVDLAEAAIALLRPADLATRESSR